MVAIFLNKIHFVLLLVLHVIRNSCVKLENREIERELQNMTSFSRQLKSMTGNDWSVRRKKGLGFGSF